ncbi:MAG: biliverdin-producing heme oxygenase [Sulfitobacter sp.]|nr:biliverdin-producing heme oxygenase [Sulfitobacter sp.]
MHVSSESDVRQALAEATAPAHRALHVHPWIARLNAPDLSVQVYRQILSAYYSIYAEVEARRVAADVYVGLGLGPAVSALAADISALEMGRATRWYPVSAAWMEPVEILGALYVLHGSGFGARVLNASIARNLPAVPRNYFALGTSPILWRNLKGALQAFADKPAGQEKLIESANATFLRVGQAVTRHCEERTDSPAADAKL